MSSIKPPIESDVGFEFSVEYNWLTLYEDRIEFKKIESQENAAFK